MLTEKEKEFLKKGEEFEEDENLKGFYRKKIRDKGKEALSDLAFIADKTSKKQFKKIFLEREAEKFIENLITPPDEMDEYEEFYKSFKTREDILKNIETSIDEWKRVEELEPRIEISTELDWGREISKLSEILEEHDKKKYPGERILRVCNKWLTHGGIVEKTDLPEEKVRDIRNRLVKEGKIILQKPAYRYKAKQSLSEREKEKYL